jgi:DNA replication protein DnaC
MNLLIDKSKFDYSEMKALNVAKSLVIDELKESQQQIILPYGIRFRIGDLVTNLYSVWQERNTRTIVTTNLPPAPGGIFDDREFDRMVEMFSSVNWNGGSLRKSK